ncbi:MAG: CHAP domain-containing protein [Myxococcota bacterium]
MAGEGYTRPRARRVRQLAWAVFLIGAATALAARAGANGPRLATEEEKIETEAAPVHEPACRDIRCSDRGRCFTERGRPFCLCREGFAANGLACESSTQSSWMSLRGRRSQGVGERVVAIAMGEVNKGPGSVGRERTTYPLALREYVPRGQLWCSDFVAWVYRAAGVPFTGGSEGGWLIGGNFAIRHWFRRHGRWIDRRSPAFSTYAPQPGDYVRIRTLRGGHSGIVHRVDGEDLLTIEGNVGNRVRTRRHRNYRNSRVDGFGPLRLEPSEALD